MGSASMPPIRACMRVTCLNPDVEFTVSYEILIMLGIEFITKTKLNCAQGSDTNLEFNT